MAAGSTPRSLELELIFNKEAGECQWPTHGKRAQACEFNFSHREPITGLKLKGGDKLEIVTIPAGTKIYHATSVVSKEKEWFKNGFKMQSPVKRFGALLSIAEEGRGGAGAGAGATPIKLFSTIKGSWFASTIDHAKNIKHTYMLEIELKEDLTLLFIQNIATSYPVKKGINLFALGNPYMKNIEVLKTKYSIDGYVGCNECEIFVKDTSYHKLGIPKVLYHDLSRMGGGKISRKNPRHRRQHKTRKQHRALI